MAQIKKIGVDYVLKTPRKELTINTRIIEKNALDTLIDVLAKLPLPQDKTPFANAQYQ